MQLNGARHLDSVVVIKACQAICRETSIRGFSLTLMHVALKGSGARRGALLLAEKGKLVTAAYGETKDDGIKVQSQRDTPLSKSLPISLINFVSSSGQQVILSSTEPRQSLPGDDYLQSHRVGSLACFPIVHEKRVDGILYLENDEKDTPFTSESLFLLEVVAAQSAIAMENIQVTERFRGLLESAPDAMVIVNDNGDIVIVNSQMERLFGYAKEELLGRSLQILLPERYRTRHKELVARFLTAPKVRRMGEGQDLLGRRKDGSEFPVDISLSPFSIDDSTLVTAAIRDISERKRVENALRLAEAKYRGIFENSVDGIFTASPTREIIDVNPALARMLGSPSPAELVETLGETINHFKKRWESACSAPGVSLRDDAVEKFEAKIPRKAGEVVTVSVQVRGVRDSAGQLVQYVGVVDDVTERKKAEEALRYSEARYRTLYRDNPTMIFTVDATMTIVSANPTTARQLGYDIDELEGCHVASFFHAEDRSDIVTQIERCLADPGKVYGWQFRKICKNGKVLWVEEVGQAVFDLNGVPNVLIVCQDITERRFAEMALKDSEQRYRQLSETLEARVRETVKELREKDKLLIIQSRQAVMGEMISNIAHQWRQPLNTLALLAQEMHFYPALHQTEESSQANFKKTMDIINHMSKTIDDFRNFFRPEKEKISFSLRESVQNTLNLIEGTLKNSEILVEVVGPPDLEVVGFPNEFSQVLVNILINARDAFTSSKVTERKVVIDIFRENGKTVVTITDNAGGMPGWVLEKVFEPYFTTKGPDKGTGVGLFMCKTIVERSMNGRISARNLKDGAQFRIEL